MPAVCFYFQVHQPYRLRRGSFQDFSRNHDYFDAEKNGEVMRKVAQKCYLPMNALLLKLIERHRGEFRVAFSISGVALEQMQEYAPEVLASFQALAATGAVEFLSETSHHSLAALYDPVEFSEQVELHRDLVGKLFKATPTVFRNTELIYSDEIGKLVAALGYRGMIAEGWDEILGWRSPNFVYQAPGTQLSLLLKNYKLSDDIAFRFGNQGWECFPLRAETFASWVHQASGNGETVNLFMDYETFGEHQWESTGIFQFMEALPEWIQKHPDWGFRTPSQVIAECRSVGELSYPRLVSWADTERDLSAWRGNSMQNSALEQVYELAPAVRRSGDPQIQRIWRRLLTSDHFYYMCTKWFADGDVHAYFSPYESPYEAFIYFMNAIKDFRAHYLGLAPVAKAI